MENKDMTGVLFVVEDVASDKHPNLTGHLLVKGEKYYISAWSNTAQKTGKMYMKLTLQNPFKKDNMDATPVPEHTKGDLPF